MESETIRGSSSILTERWFVTAALTVIGAISAYILFESFMMAAADLLQRMLMVFPLLFLILIPLLSSSADFHLPLPGSEPDSFHRAGTSPWGVAVVVIFLFFLISR